MCYYVQKANENVVSKLNFDMDTSVYGQYEYWVSSTHHPSLFSSNEN